jgi:hypothetical protein
MKSGEPYSLCIFEVALVQACKKMIACFCFHPNNSIVKRLNWFIGGVSKSFFSFICVAFEVG